MPTQLLGEAGIPIGESLSATPERVRAAAGLLAENEIAFYQANPDKYQMEGALVDGTGKITVVDNFNSETNPSKPWWNNFNWQEIEFINGELISVRVGNDVACYENSYSYNIRAGEIKFGFVYATSDWQNRHVVACTLSDGVCVLSETNRIWPIDLAIDYEVFEENGTIGFRAVGMSYVSYPDKHTSVRVPFPAEDFLKLMPGGREVSLWDVVLCAVQPYSSLPGMNRPSYLPRIPEPRNSPGFIQIGSTWEVRPHQSFALNAPDRKGVSMLHGHAFPYRDEAEQYSWMVLVHNNKHPGDGARALKVTVSPENVSVREVDGKPVIEATVYVDGTVVSITQPRTDGSFEETLAKLAQGGYRDRIIDVAVYQYWEQIHSV